MADFLTILEHKGGFKGKKLVYLGDGNNVAVSLLFGATLLGMDFTIAAPKGYELHPAVWKIGEQFAAESGAAGSLERFLLLFDVGKELVERLGEQGHAVDAELVGYRVHVDAELLELFDDLACSGQIVADGDLRLSLAQGRFDRVRRQGVDGVGADQVVDVLGGRVVRVFGAGAGPYGTLNAGALCHK